MCFYIVEKQTGQGIRWRNMWEGTEVEPDTLYLHREEEHFWQDHVSEITVLKNLKDRCFGESIWERASQLIFGEKEDGMKVECEQI